MQTQSVSDAVLCNVKDHVAHVTLNHPDRLNAISDEVRNGLLNSMRKAAADPEVKAVLLKGAGRAFSAGADMSGNAGARSLHDWRDSFLDEMELFSTMLNLPKIIVAQTHGYVLGVGFWIMNACDAVFSTDDCKFGVPEIRQQTSCWFMFNPANIPRNQAFLMMTGDHFDANTARSMGIISKVVPRDRIDKEVSKYVRKLALIDQKALTLNKAALNAWYKVPSWHEILRYQVENCGVIYTSPAATNWLSSRARKGQSMKEYLTEREAPFRAIDAEA